LSADEERDLALVDIGVKTVLTPARTIVSKIIIDVDSDEKAVGQELKSGSPGQMMISDGGEIVNDVGMPVEDETAVPSEDNVIHLRSNRSAKA